MTQDAMTTEGPEPEDEPSSPAAAADETAEKLLPESEVRTLLAAQDAQAQERFLRLAAEYDNFKRRTAKEREEWSGRALDAFLQEPERFAAMGQAGRALLEKHHSLPAYIDGLLELCKQTSDLSVRWAENRLADRIGTIARASSVEPEQLDRTGELIVDLFERYTMDRT